MAIRKNNKLRPPLSGDRLVDLHFKLILDSIHHKISAIKKKKNLIDPDEKNPNKKRKALWGLYSFETKEVFLSASECKHPTKMSMVSSLIHEIYHEIMPEVFHHRIYQIERVLAVRLTDEQKRYLKKYIPKREVKNGPVPAE
ncbi:MAG: hypothetical protein Q7K16_00965 [Candidatus Azambacteria bacterium]|nr:hypothetical protein [Candidatus Azambacteria bacterium]